MPQSLKVKLTDRSVTKVCLPQGAKDVTFWDTDLPGFGLRLREESRNYIIMYRLPGVGRTGPPRRLTVGPPSVLSATDARSAARTLLGQAACGIDPAAERRKKEAAVTRKVEALIANYEQHLRSRHYVAVSQVISVLRRGLKSYLKMNVDQLTSRDFLKLVESIERSGRQGAAAEFRTRSRTFLSWCLASGFTNQNPLAGYRKPRSTRAEMLLRGRPGRALNEAEIERAWGAADPSTVAGRYVRFLFLTGCRRREAAALTWAMVNFETREIRLPAWLTKQGREHVVGLSPLLIALLQSCPRDCRSDLVFPSIRTGQMLSGWTHLRDRIVKRSGVRFTFHDIRRTFRTGLSKLNVDKDLCEIAIGHCRGELQEIYDRNDYAESMICVFTAWSCFVEYISTGVSTKARSYASFAALRFPATGTCSHSTEPVAAAPTAMLPHCFSSLPERPISSHRRRAEELANIHISNPESFPLPLRRVEIVRLLNEELGVTQNQAVVAATKALSAIDAGAVCRNTRRSPISRSLSSQVKDEIQRLHGLGLSGAAIGRELGIITRTVNQNILKMKSERRPS